MRFKILYFLLFTFISIKSSVAQDTLVRNIIEQLNLEDEDFDISEISIQLEKLKSKPININKATKEELSFLFFLNPLQIESILKHIQQNGKLLDLVELQSIQGLDVETVEALLPFLTLGTTTSNLSLKNSFSQNQHRILIRYAQQLEKSTGFIRKSGNRYLGSPDKLLIRYNFNGVKHLNINLTLEKDAGETYIQKDRKIPDYISGNISLNNIGKINKLIIGDYNAQFGQGLTLWTGFALGKGADIIGLTRNENGLKTYTSTNEFSFLRGIAFNTSLSKNLLVNVFYSNRNLDAKIDWINGEGYVSNINTSGLHRTSSEINNQESLNQQIHAGALQAVLANFQITAIAYHTIFNHQFKPANPLYNQFNFQGNNLINFGLAYNRNFKNMYLFGEVAKSRPGNIAFIKGLLISLSPTISLSSVYRCYPVNYYTTFSNAIGENNTNNNENGLYTGLNLQFGKRFKFSIYVDEFRFPWLKYRVNSPSFGREFQSTIFYIPNKSIKHTLSYKTGLKPQNSDQTLHIPQITHYNKEQLKYQNVFDFNQKTGIRTHLYLSQFQKEGNKEFGYALLLDFLYKPVQKLNGNIRLGYFNTSYNTRIYAYEQDVLHAGGFGMYYGKGIRFYTNLKVQLTNNINIWSKYILSIYPKNTSIGSGLDEIPGNKKQEVKFQIIYAL